MKALQLTKNVIFRWVVTFSKNNLWQFCGLRNDFVWPFSRRTYTPVPMKKDFSVPYADNAYRDTLELYVCPLIDHR